MLGTFVAAAIAPLVTRLLGRDAGYVLAAWCLVAVGLVAARAPDVLNGEVVRASWTWIPHLGVRVSVALDGLSLLFSLLVLGIGAVVFAYSCRYLTPGAEHGGFYGMLALFAASMLGLVLADDLVLLFVFWELTSVSSYFLIGGRGRGAAGRSATRALVVTGFGGLALLAGLILLGVATGTTDLGAILASPEGLRGHPFAPAIDLLILLGAVTKSAQFPFHFWLPGAMVAPTPASTYLHAATMVKAGIYLLIRFSPVNGSLPGWEFVVLLTGLTTALVGGVLAIKQYDLKRLLAYSTVSQLGFMVALVGAGTDAALAAASILILAHALFKSALFMVVGIVDREAGSRDIRLLSGLRKAMPLTAATTGLAALSMAGVPPLLGFISKEEAFGAFLVARGPGWFAVVATTMGVAAAVTTFTYSLRILDGAFGGPLLQENLYEPSRAFLAPAAITALLGLLLGISHTGFDRLASRIVETTLGQPADVHFALWHGFSLPLWLSILTYTVGTTLFVLRGRTDELLHRVALPHGGQVFDALYDGTIRFGKAVGAPFLSRSPAVHAAWVLGGTVVVAGAAWRTWWAGPAGPATRGEPGDWLVVGLIAAAAVAAVRARQRIAAVALVGAMGFLVAVMYVLLGAPDLAITQLLVETLTITLVVLVFRRLPSTFRLVRRLRRLAAGLTAAAVGLVAGLGTYLITGRRDLSDVGAYYLRAAPEEAGGRNVVNTILVDFRALDTLGEVTVIAMAAIGVVALIRMRTRGEP